LVTILTEIKRGTTQEDVRRKSICYEGKKVNDTKILGIGFDVIYQQNCWTFEKLSLLFIIRGATIFNNCLKLELLIRKQF
jgi:hypothetical protein